MSDEKFGVLIGSALLIILFSIGYKSCDNRMTKRLQCMEMGKDLKECSDALN